jgi:GT2 family glycosyltransferase
LRNSDRDKPLEDENAALRRELISLDCRVRAIERSVLFRALRSLEIAVVTIKRRAGRLLLRSPFHSLYTRLGGGVKEQNRYATWFARHRRGDPLISRQVPGELARVRFSIVLPTVSPNPEWLSLAVESVRNQTWPNWELCISEDGEMSSEVRRWLDEQAAGESRIVLTRGDASGISAALNRGVNVSSGEYLAFLDHDDLLEPTALAHVAAKLSTGSFDLIYTDEDYVDSQGKPLRPNFKPGWSPALLHECMYMGHLIVARRELVLLAGGFDPDTDGAQDFDLVLKLTDSNACVGHIPRVLYHWRSHRGSTAQSPAAKPRTQSAGKKALQASIRRGGGDAEVTDDGRPNIYRVTPRAQNRDITLIIPSRNPVLLRRCLKAIRKTVPFGERLQLVVVHHETEAATNLAMRSIIAEYGASTVSFSGPFNFAQMMNLGAMPAAGEILVFLNDDIEAVNEDWLVNLTSPLGNSDIGVTGARLLYPNGAIQHAGIVLGMGDGSGHGGRFLFDSSWWPWINYTRDVSAVTGACLATTAELFRALAGFDECFPNNYNDVDYCLRARSHGFRVVIRNEAVLTHREGMSRQPGTDLAERLLFSSRWGRLLNAPDPFFSPHLSADRENLSPDMGQ